MVFIWLTTFILSSILDPSLIAYAQYQRGPVEAQTLHSPEASSVSRDTLAGLNLPPDIGRIERFYAAPENEDSGRIVLLVQDAHAIPDAQRSLRRIIEYLQSNHAVNFVGVEGTEGRIDSTLLRAFPEWEILEKIISGYLQSGELSGAAAAAILSDGEFVFYGVERWSLYQEAIDSFLNALTLQEDFRSKLARIADELERLKREYYSQELYEFDEKVLSFSAEDGELTEVLIHLEKAAQKTGFSKNVTRFPHLTAVMEQIMREDSERAIPASEIRDWAERVLQSLESREDELAFNRKFQSFQTQEIGSDEFVHYLFRLSREKDAAVPKHPAIQKAVEIQSILKQMTGIAFFEELETFAGKIKHQLIHSEQEKAIDRLSRLHQLLVNLSELQLSFAEWNELASDERLSVLTGAGAVRALSEDLQAILSDLGNDFYSFRRFYELALERDQAMSENLLRRMQDENQDISIFVAGGFHTQGLEENFKERGISYALISPAIQTVPEDNRYFDFMQGRVSWADYFKAEDGRIDLYEAFTRATVRKLLDDGDPRFLKAWRDAIIKHLSNQNRIEEARQYTRFLDAAAAEHLDPERIEKLKRAWLERVDHFVEELKVLKNENRLTPENILQIANQATAMAWNAIPSQRVPVSWASGEASSEFAAAGVKQRFETRADIKIAPVRAEVRAATQTLLDRDDSLFHRVVDDVSQELLKQKISGFDLHEHLFSSQRAPEEDVELAVRKIEKKHSIKLTLQDENLILGYAVEYLVRQFEEILIREFSYSDITAGDIYEFLEKASRPNFDVNADKRYKSIDTIFDGARQELLKAEVPPRHIKAYLERAAAQLEKEERLEEGYSEVSAPRHAALNRLLEEPLPKEAGTTFSRLKSLAFASGLTLLALGAFGYHYFKETDIRPDTTGLPVYQIRGPPQEIEKPVQEIREEDPRRFSETEFDLAFKTNIDLDTPMDFRIAELDLLIEAVLQAFYPDASWEEIDNAKLYWLRVAYHESDSLRTKIQYSEGGPGTGLWQIETTTYDSEGDAIGSSTAEDMLRRVLDESSPLSKYKNLAIQIFGSEDRIQHFAANADLEIRATGTKKQNSDELREYIITHDAAGLFLALLNLEFKLEVKLGEPQERSIEHIPQELSEQAGFWADYHWGGRSEKVRQRRIEKFNAKVDLLSKVLEKSQAYQTMAMLRGQSSPAMEFGAFFGHEVQTFLAQTHVESRSEMRRVSDLAVPFEPDQQRKFDELRDYFEDRYRGRIRPQLGRLQPEDGTVYDAVPFKLIPEAIEALAPVRGLRGKSFLGLGAGDLRIELVARQIYDLDVTAVEKDARLSMLAQEVLSDAENFENGGQLAASIDFKGATDAFELDWTNYDFLFFYFTDPGGEETAEYSYIEELRKKLAAEMRPDATLALLLHPYAAERFPGIPGFKAEDVPLSDGFILKKFKVNNRSEVRLGDTDGEPFENFESLLYERLSRLDPEDIEAYLEALRANNLQDIENDSYLQEIDEIIGGVAEETEEEPSLADLIPILESLYPEILEHQRTISRRGFLAAAGGAVGLGALLSNYAALRLFRDKEESSSDLSAYSPRIVRYQDNPEMQAFIEEHDLKIFNTNFFFEKYGKSKASGLVRDGRDREPINANGRGFAEAKAVFLVNRHGEIKIIDTPVHTGGSSRSAVNAYIDRFNEEYPVEEWPYAFQAGPVAVREGEVNPRLFDSRELKGWYRGWEHGRAVVVGIDDEGNFHTKDIRGLDILGVTGSSVTAFKRTLEDWQERHRIQSAMFTDGGTTGILREAPYVLVMVPNGRLEDFKQINEPRSEVRFQSPGGWTTQFFPQGDMVLVTSPEGYASSFHGLGVSIQPDNQVVFSNLTRDRVPDHLAKAFPPAYFHQRLPSYKPEQISVEEFLREPVSDKRFIQFTVDRQANTVTIDNFYPHVAAGRGRGTAVLRSLLKDHPEWKGMNLIIETDNPALVKSFLRVHEINPTAVFRMGKKKHFKLEAFIPARSEMREGLLWREIDRKDLFTEEEIAEIKRRVEILNGLWSEWSRQWFRGSAKRTMLDPSFLLTLLNVKPVYFPARGGPNPNAFIQATNDEFQKELDKSFYFRPVLTALPRFIETVVRNAEFLKTNNFAITDQELQTLSEMMQQPFDQWRTIDKGVVFELFQRLYVTVALPGELSVLLQGIFSGYPAEDIKRFIDVGGGKISVGELEEAMKLEQTEFKGNHLWARDENSEAVNRALARMRAALYYAYSQFRRQRDFKKHARAAKLPNNVFYESMPEAFRVRRRSEQRSFKDVLDETNFDRAKITGMIYPASDERESKLAVQIKKVAPNLADIHYVLLPDAERREFMKVSMLNEMEAALGDAWRDIFFNVHAGDYRVLGELLFEKEGSRIWVDNPEFFGKELRRDAGFYRQAFEAGHIRAGQDIVITFQEGTESFPWSNVLASDVAIPGYDGLWTVAVPTEKDRQRLDSIVLHRALLAQDAPDLLQPVAALTAQNLAEFQSDLDLWYGWILQHQDIDRVTFAHVKGEEVHTTQFLEGTNQKQTILDYVSEGPVRFPLRLKLLRIGEKNQIKTELLVEPDKKQFDFRSESRNLHEVNEERDDVLFAKLVQDLDWSIFNHQGVIRELIKAIRDGQQMEKGRLPFIRISEDIFQRVKDKYPEQEIRDAMDSMKLALENGKSLHKRHNRFLLENLIQLREDVLTDFFKDLVRLDANTGRLVNPVPVRFFRNHAPPGFIERTMSAVTGTFEITAGYRLEIKDHNNRSLPATWIRLSKVEKSSLQRLLADVLVMSPHSVMAMVELEWLDFIEKTQNQDGSWNDEKIQEELHRHRTAPRTGPRVGRHLFLDEEMKIFLFDTDTKQQIKLLVTNVSKGSEPGNERIRLKFLSGQKGIRVYGPNKPVKRRTPSSLRTESVKSPETNIQRRRAAEWKGIHLAGEEVATYFGKTIAAQVKGEGTEFIIQRLHRQDMSPHMDSWKQASGIRNKKYLKWKEFYEGTPLIYGMISRKGEKEKLEGYFNVTLRDDGLFYIEQMASHPDNTGSDGAIKGIPQALFDYVIKDRVEFSDDEVLALAFNALSHGSKEFALRLLGIQPEAGAQEIQLDENQIRDLYQAHKLGQKFNGRSETRAVIRSEVRDKIEKVFLDFAEILNEKIPRRSEHAAIEADPGLQEQELQTLITLTNRLKQLSDSEKRKLREPILERWNPLPATETVDRKRPHEKLSAFHYQGPEDRHAIVVINHNRYGKRESAFLKLDLQALGLSQVNRRHFYLFHDAVTGRSYLRRGFQLERDGLFVSPETGHHVFWVEDISNRIKPKPVWLKLLSNLTRILGGRSFDSRLLSNPHNEKTGMRRLFANFDDAVYKTEISELRYIRIDGLEEGKVRLRTAQAERQLDDKKGDYLLLQGEPGSRVAMALASLLTPEPKNQIKALQPIETETSKFFERMAPIAQRVKSAVGGIENAKIQGLKILDGQKDVIAFAVSGKNQDGREEKFLLAINTAKSRKNIKEYASVELPEEWMTPNRTVHEITDLAPSAFGLSPEEKRYTQTGKKIRIGLIPYAFPPQDALNQWMHLFRIRSYDIAAPRLFVHRDATHKIALEEGGFSPTPGKVTRIQLGETVTVRARAAFYDPEKKQIADWMPEDIEKMVMAEVQHNFGYDLFRSVPARMNRELSKQGHYVFEAELPAPSVPGMFWVNMIFRIHGDVGGEAVWSLPDNRDRRAIIMVEVPEMYRLIEGHEKRLAEATRDIETRGLSTADELSRELKEKAIYAAAYSLADAFDTGEIVAASHFEGKPGQPVQNFSYLYSWIRDGVQGALQYLDSPNPEIQKIAENYLNFLWRGHEDKIRFTDQRLRDMGGRVLRPVTSFNDPQTDGPAHVGIFALEYLKAMADGRRPYEAAQKEKAEKLLGTALPEVVQMVKNSYLYLTFGGYAPRENPQGFDIWEEIFGLHFSNFLIAYSFLKEAEAQIRRLGLNTFVDLQAPLIGQLNAHDLLADIIKSQFKMTNEEGLFPKHFVAHRKASNAGKVDSEKRKERLDTQMLWAMQYADHMPFKYSDPLALGTYNELRNLSRNWGSYNAEIRKRYPHVVAMMRYFGDRYDGTHYTEEVYTGTGLPGNTGAHYWFIATLWPILFDMKFAAEEMDQGRFYVNSPAYEDYLKELLKLEIPDFKTSGITVGKEILPSDPLYAMILNAIQERVDQTLQFVSEYITPEGGLWEQFRADSGAQQGTAELNWSNLTFVDAVFERDRFIKMLQAQVIPSRQEMREPEEIRDFEFSEMIQGLDLENKGDLKVLQELAGVLGEIDYEAIRQEPPIRFSESFFAKKRRFPAVQEILENLEERLSEYLKQPKQKKFHNEHLLLRMLAFKDELLLEALQDMTGVVAETGFLRNPSIVRLIRESADQSRFVGQGDFVTHVEDIRQHRLRLFNDDKVIIAGFSKEDTPDIRLYLKQISQKENLSKAVIEVLTPPSVIILNQGEWQNLQQESAKRGRSHFERRLKRLAAKQKDRATKGSLDFRTREQRIFKRDMRLRSQDSFVLVDSFSGRELKIAAGRIVHSSEAGATMVELFYPHELPLGVRVEGPGFDRPRSESRENEINEQDYPNELSKILQLAAITVDSGIEPEFMEILQEFLKRYPNSEITLPSDVNDHDAMIAAAEKMESHLRKIVLEAREPVIDKQAAMKSAYQQFQARQSKKTADRYNSIVKSMQPLFYKLRRRIFDLYRVYLILEAYYQKKESPEFQNKLIRNNHKAIQLLRDNEGIIQTPDAIIQLNLSRRYVQFLTLRKLKAYNQQMMLGLIILLDQDASPVLKMRIAAEVLETLETQPLSLDIYEIEKTVGMLFHAANALADVGEQNLAPWTPELENLQARLYGTALRFQQFTNDEKVLEEVLTRLEQSLAGEPGQVFTRILQLDSKIMLANLIQNKDPEKADRIFHEVINSQNENHGLTAEILDTQNLKKTLRDIYWNSVRIHVEFFKAGRAGVTEQEKRQILSKLAAEAEALANQAEKEGDEILILEVLMLASILHQRTGDNVKAGNFAREFLRVMGRYQEKAEWARHFRDMVRGKPETMAAEFSVVLGTVFAEFEYWEQLSVDELKNMTLLLSEYDPDMLPALFTAAAILIKDTEEISTPIKERFLAMLRTFIEEDSQKGLFTAYDLIQKMKPAAPDLAVQVETEIRRWAEQEAAQGARLHRYFSFSERLAGEEVDKINKAFMAHMEAVFIISGYEPEALFKVIEDIQVMLDDIWFARKRPDLSYVNDAFALLDAYRYRIHRAQPDRFPEYLERLRRFLIEYYLNYKEVLEPYRDDEKKLFFFHHLAVLLELSGEGTLSLAMDSEYADYFMKLYYDPKNEKTSIKEVEPSVDFDTYLIGHSLTAFANIISHTDPLGQTIEDKRILSIWISLLERMIKNLEKEDAEFLKPHAAKIFYIESAMTALAKLSWTYRMRFADPDEGIRPLLKRLVRLALEKDLHGGKFERLRQLVVLSRLIGDEESEKRFAQKMLETKPEEIRFVQGKQKLHHTNRRLEAYLAAGLLAKSGALTDSEAVLIKVREAVRQGSEFLEEHANSDSPDHEFLAGMLILLAHFDMMEGNQEGPFHKIDRAMAQDLPPGYQFFGMVHKAFFYERNDQLEKARDEMSAAVRHQIETEKGKNKETAIVLRGNALEYLSWTAGMLTEENKYAMSRLLFAVYTGEKMEKENAALIFQMMNIFGKRHKLKIFSEHLQRIQSNPKLFRWERDTALIRESFETAITPAQNQKLFALLEGIDLSSPEHDKYRKNWDEMKKKFKKKFNAEDWSAIASYQLQSGDYHGALESVRFGLSHSQLREMSQDKRRGIEGRLKTIQKTADELSAAKSLMSALYQAGLYEEAHEAASDLFSKNPDDLKADQIQRNSLLLRGALTQLQEGRFVEVLEALESVPAEHKDAEIRKVIRQLKDFIEDLAVIERLLNQGLYKKAESEIKNSLNRLGKNLFPKKWDYNEQSWVEAEAQLRQEITAIENNEKKLRDQILQAQKDSARDLPESKRKKTESDLTELLQQKKLKRAEQNWNQELKTIIADMRSGLKNHERVRDITGRIEEIREEVAGYASLLQDRNTSLKRLETTAKKMAFYAEDRNRVYDLLIARAFEAFNAAGEIKADEPRAQRRRGRRGRRRQAERATRENAYRKAMNIGRLIYRLSEDYPVYAERKMEKQIPGASMPKKKKKREKQKSPGEQTTTKETVQDIDRSYLRKAQIVISQAAANIWLPELIDDYFIVAHMRQAEIFAEEKRRLTLGLPDHVPIEYSFTKIRKRGDSLELRGFNVENLWDLIRYSDQFTIESDEGGEIPSSFSVAEVGKDFVRLKLPHGHEDYQHIIEKIKKLQDLVVNRGQIQGLIRLQRNSVWDIQYESVGPAVHQLYKSTIGPHQREVKDSGRQDDALNLEKLNDAIKQGKELPYREASLGLGTVIDEMMGLHNPLPEFLGLSQKPAEPVMTEEQRIEAHIREREEAERIVLDDLQRKAMHAALGSKHSYVLFQGPPGTGKTTLIQWVSDIFQKAGSHVRVIAQQNEALDNILKRVIRRVLLVTGKKEDDELSQKDIERHVNFARLGNRGDLIAKKILPIWDNKELLFNKMRDLSRKSRLGTLLFGTAIGSHTDSLLRERVTFWKADVLVIDEASRATRFETLAALARYQGLRKIILVGDHKQLPAYGISQKDIENAIDEFVSAKLRGDAKRRAKQKGGDARFADAKRRESQVEEMAFIDTPFGRRTLRQVFTSVRRRNFKISLFERVQKLQYSEDNGIRSPDEMPFYMLQIQRRSVPRIVQITNYFYGNTLKIFRKKDQGIVELIDTGGNLPENNREKGKIFNPGEVLIVVNWINRLMNDRLLKGENLSSHEMAVISPYNQMNREVEAAVLDMAAIHTYLKAVEIGSKKIQVPETAVMGILEGDDSDNNSDSKNPPNYVLRRLREIAVQAGLNDEEYARQWVSDFKSLISSPSPEKARSLRERIKLGENFVSYEEASEDWFDILSIDASIGNEWKAVIAPFVRSNAEGSIGFLGAPQYAATGEERDEEGRRRRNVWLSRAQDVLIMIADVQHFSDKARDEEVNAWMKNILRVLGRSESREELTTERRSETRETISTLMDEAVDDLLRQMATRPRILPSDGIQVLADLAGINFEAMERLIRARAPEYFDDALESGSIRIETDRLADFASPANLERLESLMREMLETRDGNLNFSWAMQFPENAAVQDWIREFIEKVDSLSREPAYRNRIDAGIAMLVRAEQRNAYESFASGVTSKDRIRMIDSSETLSFADNLRVFLDEHPNALIYELPADLRGAIRSGDRRRLVSLQEGLLPGEAFPAFALMNFVTAQELEITAELLREIPEIITFNIVRYDGKNLIVLAAVRDFAFEQTIDRMFAMAA